MSEWVKVREREREKERKKERENEEGEEARAPLVRNEPEMKEGEQVAAEIIASRLSAEPLLAKLLEMENCNGRQGCNFFSSVLNAWL